MISVGFMGLRYFSGMPAFAGIGPRLYDRYGPLLNDPDGVFNLPKDFSYKIISRSGAPMDDGFLSPGKNDAMAAFEGPDGTVIVVRNHEVPGKDLENGPFGKTRWEERRTGTEGGRKCRSRGGREH